MRSQPGVLHTTHKGFVIHVWEKNEYDCATAACCARAAACGSGG